MPNMGNSDQVEKGLGLGLAIVRRLADLQKLSVDLATSPSGTTITINGFKSAPLSQKSKPSKGPTDRIGAIFDNKRILVVDDDEETLKATVSLLQAWGCLFASAESLEALDQIEGPIDLVISDYSFPARYTGLDIIRDARVRYGKDLKALVISGDLSDEVQQRVKQEKLLLIHKPVQPVQLRSAMLGLFSSDSDAQIIS